MFLMCYFFQNLHIGKFFYMGNSNYGSFLLYGLLVYYMLLLTNVSKTKYH